ncbi:MAG: tetratricopeptide repeat protein [Anaerolineae bacterium]|nr:tetratricopeptide repeat protein [Anaerolineae bacterium]
MRRLSLLLALAVLAGCCPSPNVPATPPSPLRLPTRVPATATPAPTRVDARPLYEAGLACREAGDDECALRSFTQAIEIDPGFAPAYIARGSVHLAQGQLDAALDDAESAVAADPEDASAYALRGEILRQLDRPHEASKAFDQAVALDTALGEEVFQSRWLAALAGHDVQRLTDLSRQYGKDHPEDPLRRYYRGWAYIEQGHSDIAIHLLVEGIKDTPKPPALLWFTLGHAYLEDGSWQEAVTSFEIAGELIRAGDVSLELHTERPIADFFAAMGQAYLGVGRCADAETMLDHAVAVAGPVAEYLALLEKVDLCKTPTPTPTPYPTTTPPA